MKRILLASGWLLVLASSTSAADLPQAYTKAPAVSPAVNWSGFYIGAMGGYAWSDQLRATALGVTATSNTSETSGGFGGGTIGYNWQVDSWVFGLEAEAAGASISHSSTAFIITGTERIDAFGSVTGRVGFAAAVCVPKTLSVLMEQWNHLSWRNDRAAPFRFGRPGLAIQVEVAA
jgi:outer membrane immunogenic protein